MENDFVKYIEDFQKSVKLVIEPPNQDLISEALSNQNTRLTAEKYDDYVLALARYELWLQKEINKIKSFILYLDDAIYNLVKDRLGEAYMSYKDKIRVAAHKIPEAREMLIKKNSLERQVASLDFIAPKIHGLRETYINLLKRNST